MQFPLEQSRQQIVIGLNRNFNVNGVELNGFSHNDILLWMAERKVAYLSFVDDTATP
jgi:hypothetical protein